mgnify:CR=1 FL=1
MLKQTMLQQTKHAFAHARTLLEGVQAALDELREDLILRHDEARDESAREAYDEMLTVVDARLLEYRRRQAAQPG